jgi:HEPN domain-containing protein
VITIWETGNKSDIIFTKCYNSLKGIYMHPTKPEEWIDVAKERAEDAVKLTGRGEDAVGAVYIAGYAIECSLKAYFRKIGKAFPRTGKDGHNLRGLWRDSGHKLFELRAVNEFRSFYIDKWSVDLRYESRLPIGFEKSSKELVDAAKELTGIVQNWVRWESAPRRKR